jgi:hypothetical protein
MPKASTSCSTLRATHHHSPIHRASSRGPAAPTVPRGRLRRHDLRLSSPSLHDLRASALHHSSGLLLVVPSCLMCATVEHPSPVRFSSLRHLNQISREPEVVLDQIPRLPMPPIHRILAGATIVRHDLSASSVSPWAGSQVYLGPARGGPLEQ